MDARQLVAGALLLRRPWTMMLCIIVMLAGALGACSTLALDGDHLRTVPQYSTITFKAIAYSNCSAEDYTITAFSDLPVRVTPSAFAFGHSSKAVSVSVSPGSAEPGLYTVHLLMESRSNIAREEFVVDVAEGVPILVAEAPAVMQVAENEGFDIAIALENRGDVTINNVVVFIDEAGQARKYSDALESLQPGARKYVNMNFGPRSRGDYSLNYTATAGELAFKGRISLGAGIKNYPFLTMATVKDHANGYAVDYLVRNTGPTRMSDLFLTVEDAPGDWDIISPSGFSLGPGESREVELIALHGKDTDATITLALYEGSTLRAEDSVELSQARLRGTGLISFADSFTLGLGVLLALAVVFLAFRLQARAKAKNVSIRSLLPDWLPF